MSKKKYSLPEIKEMLKQVIPNELRHYELPLSREDIYFLTQDIIISLEDNLD